MDGTVDLGAEFAAAVRLFRPLLETGRTALEVVPELIGDTINALEPATDGQGTIRGAVECFLALYPETRASKGFGVDSELWASLNNLQRMLFATPTLRPRPHVHVTWSVGQGNWARVPWVALLDQRLTTSTQRGVYGALLFREDMTSAYLTYNQGVTQPKKDHGATAGLQLLRENAHALRETCPELADWASAWTTASTSAPRPRSAATTRFRRSRTSSTSAAPCPTTPPSPPISRP